MAKLSISDLASFQNRQHQIHEKLTTHLERLEALITAVLTINFFELNKHTMHCYFSVVADLIHEVIQLNRTHFILSP